MIELLPTTSAELAPLLGEISATIEQVLNGDGPKRWGFVLIVVPVDIDKPTAELRYNIRHDDLLAMLKEGLAREEGRLHEKGGTA